MSPSPPSLPTRHPGPHRHSRLGRRRWLVGLACTVLATGEPASAGAPGPAASTAPAIVPVSDWGGSPLGAAAASAALPAQIPSRLTVHHQGEVWPEGKEVAPYLQRLQRWSRQTRGWVDIPYHYIVAPDGQVYAARPVELPGDSNTDYDTRGHLQLMLLGNFELQQPTAAQWQATVALLAWLMREHGLGPERIGAHRDHSDQTVCPGAHLMQRFDALREQAAALR